MKHDLFISYSRKDLDEVNRFVELLKKRIPALNIWFDITGIESGDEFEDKIISAIDNSSYVIFALSDNSLASDWTKDEVMYAKNTEKKIIPLLLKGAELKGWFLFRFGRIDCIDITSEMQINKLVGNLSSWSGKAIASKSEAVKPADKKPAAKNENLTVADVAKLAKVLKADDSRYEIVLQSAGPAKLGVVKVIKECLGIGLKEAKDFIDAAPCTIANFVESQLAYDLKHEVEEAGGTMNMVPQSAEKAIDRGNHLYAKGKYDEAMELYMKVAQTGYPKAQYLVGVMYHNGQGCERDYEEAYNWWKLAADQGYKEAVHYIGYCHEYGRGIGKDINKAKEYYKKAADLGNEKSKEDLKRLG